MIARHFNANEKPLTPQEFADFWLSLSAEEQMFYRTVDLETEELFEERVNF